MGVQCTYYNLCFFLYFWLVPVFLQYLMRAPASFDSAPFYPVPIPTLNGDVPGLSMSSFPQTTNRGINHCRRCSRDSGHQQGVYQWDIMLRVSYKDLLANDKSKPVSTLYPVIFASNDAKNWRVVADADDVAGQGEVNEKGKEEPTHISAPLLVANLKNFGCVDQETPQTDPFMTHFPNKGRALYYKWKLVEHVAMHGSVNLVACVMQGMDAVNDMIQKYVQNCVKQGGGEMKCHLSPREALHDCFALGSACGQACGFFSPRSPVCQDDGSLDPALFEGLSEKRVRIKTSPGGGGAAQSLVDCSKDTCKKGLHFKNMYVEADNPLEFLAAQRDVQNKEKGSFYVAVLAMSDYHLPVHTFKIPLKHQHHAAASSEREGGHLHHHHHIHHLQHHTHKDTDKEKDSDKDDEKDVDEDEDEDEEEKEEDKADERTCVDLPGVRLGQIDHSDLISFVDEDALDGPAECTRQCGKRPACKQNIWSGYIKGCWLFRIATVEVNDFDDGFNSSYCGPSTEKELMMTMLHQAYKGYVPDAPPPMADAPPPAAPGAWAAPPPPPIVRRLSEKKYYFQIAHVPNLTMGMLRDTGSDSVRVIPRNQSCFTAPGFVYMVACMTAKPVYLSGKAYNLAPPPFNDRCLAVGGLCGASCGSGAEAKDGVADQCLGSSFGTDQLRRLQASPYASADIPRDMLVKRIEPRRSATSRGLAPRVFFHLFIFFIAISYIATLLSKFPGNFTDFYPMHSWDEIRTHGYVLEKYGCAVSCGCSAGESKMTVLRNWIGKISSRPQFDDSAFPTFGRWVDVFCDEGHREGARILWTAWTDFLDTNPPIEFLEQWSRNLQNLTWDMAAERSPFDLRWSDVKDQTILPVVPEQSQNFMKSDNEAEGGHRARRREAAQDPAAPSSRLVRVPLNGTPMQVDDKVPETGVELEQDSLVKLEELAEVFKLLPDNLRLEPSLAPTDDVVLSRAVRLGLLNDEDDGAERHLTVRYASGWEKEVEKHMKDRAEKLGLKSKEEYAKSLVITDVDGRQVHDFFVSGGAGMFSSGFKASEKQFPLHFREPPPRKDRQVIMIYCARAKPETEREGIDKTRELDKYLWACLRPNAVRGGKPFKKSKKKNKVGEDKVPLLERSWTSSIGPEVRRCVEGVLDRQHEKFQQRLAQDGSARRGLSADRHREFVDNYMKYRTVDSDWEMGRYCYGEIVGEVVDGDGDEALILDNPSPSILELISDLYSSDPSSKLGMGLVSVDGEGEETVGCMESTKRFNYNYVAKPFLEFSFANTDPSKSFEEERFRKQLKQFAPEMDFSGLTFAKKYRDGEFVVDVTGPGKVIELLRERNPSGLEVGSFQGRMVNTHPTVLVKKNLLMPYCGVRGKSGGLNYVVDLLQFREGFIGSGEDADPVPERMLFGIFDARHQPHPDFWRHCLPKFMNNTDYGYTYEVNEQVCMVQAPQTFASVSVEEDILDVLNGMTFNIMNVIRNRCGGVTSCGTNAIWQISAKEFSRSDEDSVTKEYFDSRTKIEDTASTHLQFCNGKRSVYVQEKISTGIAKLNADYLCAMQRWAEGAVQLFWLQLFKDKNRQLVAFAFSVILFLALIYLSLYGLWTKDLIGFNLFCDVQGEATLFTGTDHPLCSSLYGLFGTFLFHKIDKVMFEMAESDYMRLIDFAMSWLLICLGLVATTVYLSFRGTMPKIVRVVIMTENISYWLTSCSIFFWVSLTLYMIIAMDPPLMFNVTHFMLFVLCMNITQHSMINEYKNLGGCDEASIWRSQQSYTLAAPLYVMAILRGSGSAWGIIWKRLDKSFWTSNEHGSDIVVGVTLWVTFIWAAFVLCACYTLSLMVKGWIFHQAGDNISKQCQIGALCLLGLLAITVWEPFLALWGLNHSVNAMSKDDSQRRVVRWIAGLLVWWRGRAWIMRYCIDFGMPMLVLSGALGGGVSLITLATYATTVHGFRG